jgi:hypothetical protein
VVDAVFVGDIDVMLAGRPQQVPQLQRRNTEETISQADQRQMSWECKSCRGTSPSAFGRHIPGSGRCLTARAARSGRSRSMRHPGSKHIEGLSRVLLRSASRGWHDADCAGCYCTFFTGLLCSRSHAALRRMTSVRFT